MRRLVAAIASVLLLAAIATASDRPPGDERRSSYEHMSAETKTMQDDDTSNPGMLAVLDGASVWGAKAGKAEKACVDCHGDAFQSMKGVAARYPAFDTASGAPINLEGRINACRTERQQAPELRYESRELLALTAYIARHSRGLPILSDDPRLAPTIETGRRLYMQRQGQLDLACTHCHDRNWGKKLAGNTIPQGHPTGYPIYRLEWQGMGSLQRRLRNCMTGMRAESYAYGSAEFLALEAYLMWRARGMPLESPAVRP